jgi:hypothetical protein
MAHAEDVHSAPLYRYTGFKLFGLNFRTTMPTDNNSLPLLLDLRLRVRDSEEEEGQKDVRIDLRIHCSEIDGPDDAVVSVQLKKAALELELIGLDAVPNGRFGEPLRQNELVEKQTTTIRTNLEGKAAVHAGVDIAKLTPATLKLSADAVAEAKASSVYTSKQEVTEYRVKARGGDTWEVREPLTKNAPRQAPLDGTYLSDDVLCKVSRQKGANMMSVGVTAYARQRDMTLELTKGTFWQTYVNAGQEKLFKILVAKSLGLSGNKYAGIVKLSRSELEIED